MINTNKDLFEITINYSVSQLFKAFYTEIQTYIYILNGNYICEV